MGEFNSIFYEETIYTNEANSTMVSSEKLRQVVNRVLDKITKSNREEISLSHRKKLVKGMIDDIDKLIKDYDNSNQNDQKRMDNYASNDHIIDCIIVGENIVDAIHLKRTYDGYRACVIGKSYHKYMAEYSKSELQYSRKQCEKALEYIERREEKILAKKKAKHESFSFLDVDII